MKKIIGIDLGTTYSCVAHVNEYGIAEVIPNAEGEATTPSVVWFDGHRAVVGQEAKEMASIHPDAVCSFIKRNMGSDDFYFEVDQASDFGLQASGKGTEAKPEARSPKPEVHPVRYTPEHVSSLILRKLVKDASAHLGETVTDVVITCPAYFFIREREATKRAGEIAGLNVLHILNEPTAAAFAYGIKPNEKLPGRNADVTKERHILVYDLGGGTFDASVIRISQDGVDVLCTDGDHQLGGKDWDDRLVQHLARCYSDETQEHVNPVEAPELYYDLLQMAERAKKQLSTRASTKVKITHLGNTVHVELTRPLFEQQTQDLLGKTITLTKSLLKAAKTKGCTRIEQLLLVGGSSRMPQVAERLKKEFSIEPQLYDPDEAVAKGAALIGNNIQLRKLIDAKLQSRATSATTGSRALTLETASPAELKEAEKKVAEEHGYQLEIVSRATTKARNVSSKTFGIVVLDDFDDKGNPKLTVSNLIYRNTPLPAECKQTYATITNNQKMVVVELVENMCDAPLQGMAEPVVEVSDSVSLWDGDLPIQPGLPIHSPIEVTFRIDEDGRLTLIAYDPASGGKLEKHLPEKSAEYELESRKVTERSRALVVE